MSVQAFQVAAISCADRCTCGEGGARATSQAVVIHKWGVFGNPLCPGGPWLLRKAPMRARVASPSPRSVSEGIIDQTMGSCVLESGPFALQERHGRETVRR
jgi:hypothetical protein